MTIQKTRRVARRRAFTLLEILLVVGLLALLASFAIPALMQSGETAKKDMAKAAIGPNGTISQALKLFKFHTGRFPEELKDLITKPSDDDVAKKWNGPYLEDEAGLQDAWGNEFQYNAQGQHNEGSFDIWSKGPDGVDGNDDDIVNWKTDR
jgi:general secretion pathway protein G